MFIETLNADLDFRDAQVAQPTQFVGVNAILARFYDQANITSFALGVDFLRFQQRGSLDFIDGIETALDKPFLVTAPVAGPCATKDEQFDFLGRMADLLQGADAG